MGHITEAEEKKGKKEQDKGQIDIGKNKEQEGKKYWERNWVIFTSTTYYFGWYIGRDSSCIKSTSFKHAVHVQRLQKGERQYLTAFTGLLPEAETGQVPVALTAFLSFSRRPSFYHLPCIHLGEIFSLFLFFSITISSSIFPYYSRRWGFLHHRCAASVQSSRAVDCPTFDH